MVKRILLQIDDGRFNMLKEIKKRWQSARKKELTWEEFLVDWTIRWNDMIVEKTIDKAIEEATLEIRLEHRDELRKLVTTVVKDKLRYYK